MFARALRQFSTYGVGSISQSALRFILVPVYLSFLEPSEFGVISLLLVVASIVTIVAGAGALSGLHRLYYEVDVDEKRRLVGTTWSWYLLGSAFAWTLMWFNSSGFSRLLYGTGAYAYPLRLVAISCFLDPLQLMPFEVFRLERKAVHYVVFSLAKFALDFVLKLLFIVGMSRGISGYLESGVITSGVILLLMYPFVRRFVTVSRSFPNLRSVLRLGLPFVFSALSVWILTWSDRFILNYFSGQESVGIYSLAHTLARPFDVILYYPLTLLWFPFFFSFVVGREPDEVKSLLRKAVTYYTIAGCSLYLVIGLGSNDLLRIFNLFFGAKQEYLQASGLVGLVALAPLLYSVTGLIGTSLFLVKKPEYGALGVTVAAVLNVGLDLVFIPKYGGFGAAATTAFAYTVYLGLVYTWSQRRYYVNYNVAGLAKIFLFLGAAFAIGSWIELRNVWISVLLRLGVGIGVFWLSVWFLAAVLAEGEKREFVSIARNAMKTFTQGFQRWF